MTSVNKVSTIFVGIFLILNLLSLANGKISHGNRTNTKISSVVHSRPTTLTPNPSTTTPAPIHILMKRDTPNSWYEKKKRERKLNKQKTPIDPKLGLEQLSPVVPFKINENQGMPINKFQMTNEIMNNVETKYKNDPQQNEIRKLAYSSVYLINSLNPAKSEIIKLSRKNSTNIPNQSISHYLPSSNNFWFDFNKLLNPSAANNISNKQYSDPRIIPLQMNKLTIGMRDVIDKFKKRPIRKTVITNKVVKKKNSAENIIVSNMLIFICSILAFK